MLNLIKSDKEFLDSVKALQTIGRGWYGLHIDCSIFENNTQRNAMIKINILMDYFKEKKGCLYISADSDIIIVFQTDDDFFIKNCRQAISSRFFGGELFNGKQVDINTFIRSYVICLQWEEFYILSRAKAKENLKPKQAELTPTLLAEIEEKMAGIDLSHIIRYQSVCSVNEQKKAVPVFSEIYVKIDHLKKMLGVEANLTSNKLLFRCLTVALDAHVLQLLRLRPVLLPKMAYSMNLNVESLLSGSFAQFNTAIDSPKSSVIIEIDMGDIFNDINAFIEAKNHVQELGYRVCLDGLNSLSFMQIDRESLGFDLVKLQWNMDVASKLNSGENIRLANAIQRCGANRVILCRCDNNDAVEYGKALGIGLFQGRHIDFLLNPQAKIVN